MGHLQKCLNLLPPLKNQVISPKNPDYQLLLKKKIRSGHFRTSFPRGHCLLELSSGHFEKGQAPFSLPESPGLSIVPSPPPPTPSTGCHVSSHLCYFFLVKSTKKHIRWKFLLKAFFHRACFTPLYSYLALVAFTLGPCSNIYYHRHSTR